MPICPELRAILADAFERAEPGATLVVPSAGRATVNLRTHLERIITKAGHKPWPRLLQNLRASCETDWVEKYPAHVVAPWLGHSPKVAAQHYLMSREHHFEHVVNGGGATAATTAERPTAGPPSCDAYYDAPATQQASARGSAPSHETTEPAATIQVAAGSSEVTPFLKTDEMAGTGREQPASRARNPGVGPACDARYDALSPERVEVLARAVILVAQMAIPEAAREAVLARVTVELVGRLRMKSRHGTGLPRQP